MSFISRGFHRRQAEPEQAGRVPPGQYVTPDFPVLSAGPTPHRRSRTGASRSRARSTSRCAGRWDEFRALPSETVTKDIHCVTKWSKLDTTWEGVSVDTLLDGVETERRVRRSPSATAATRRTCRSRT